MVTPSSRAPSGAFPSWNAVTTWLPIPGRRRPRRRTLRRMFAGVAGGMPRQSRPSRLRCGSLRWLFLHRTHAASFHLTLKGHTSFAGGSPLVATRSLPWIPKPSAHRCRRSSSGHVPSNVRSFQVQHLRRPARSRRWAPHRSQPFEGKVIATTDEAIVVKTGRAEFAVLDRALVTEVPDERRQGRSNPTPDAASTACADTPEEETTAFTADGKPYTGAAVRARLRAGEAADPRARCPELQVELIQQMEQLPAPDGYRRITHLCWSMPARGNFTWVDPLPGTSSRHHRPSPSRWPRRSSRDASPCCTSGLDCTRWSCTAMASWLIGSMRCSSTLGGTLERLIDDGNWKRRIRV